MDESSAKKLLMQLVAARSENEVGKIIDSEPQLSNEENWKPYGGYESNFNTINNQAKNSVAALAEKPINSIDALLLKECKLRGIDPESKQAPRSMREAVEVFYGIKAADFSDHADKERRRIAEHIWIIAEGDKKRPHIIIADAGEGQHPDDFENTFLSLHRGNKNKIPFVQGKYNMGGSGVLPNCGEYNYQLILSRRTPALLRKGQKDRWGFTLVRLHVATSSEYKNSWYEYFVGEDGGIASFAGGPLSILPDNGPMESGSYIKLYNYYLPNPSQITLDLWRDLNRVLHYPVLPLTLHETRKFRRQGPIILLGNRLRILKDENKSVEDNCPPIIPIIAELGKFGKRTIEVTVFKEGTIKDEFASPGESIFFTINGQTHASIGRSFLRTKANLHYLADYMLVHIDCTDVDTNMREKIFMPSRDRMRDTGISKEIELILAEELGRHEGLRELNQLRREQQITRNPKDTKFLEGVVSKLVKKNRTILNYLGLGGNIKERPEVFQQEIREFKGEVFPTYLKLIGPNRKQMTINSYARVTFETDATNDYFSRETDKGSLIVYPDVMKSCHLWNGRMTVKLIPSKTARAGQIRKVIALLTRPYDEPLTVEFEVEYMPEIEPQIPLLQVPRLPKIKDYRLPEPILVYKTTRKGSRTWDEMRKEDGTHWNGTDITKVVPSGDGAGVDVFINMDADVLHTFLRQHKVSGRRQDFIKRSWETAVFLNSLVIYNDLSRTEKGDLVPDVMKSVSKIILDLMCNETFLKELEKGE
jgi:hypothetical protein